MLEMLRIKVSFHFLLRRMGQTGELSVDNRPSVQGTSPGQATQLNFYSNSVLYLGKDSSKWVMIAIYSYM